MIRGYLMRWISRDLPSDLDCAYIIGLSDLHIGDPRFNLDKFTGYRDWILERDNAFCIVNGDVCDNATRNSIGDTYEAALNPRQQVEMAVKLFKPLAEKNKILAWNDGNHEARTHKESGLSLGEHICAQLGIPDAYSNEGALVKIRLGQRKKSTGSHNGKPLVYLLYATHGWSGARRVGGKANAAEDLQGVVAGCDAYLVSHSHQRFVFTKDILVPDPRRNKVEVKRQLFVSCGSFLDWGGYAEKRGYHPQTMGAPRIRLDARRKDCHCSL